MKEFSHLLSSAVVKFGKRKKKKKTFWQVTLIYILMNPTVFLNIFFNIAKAKSKYGRKIDLKPKLEKLHYDNCDKKDMNMIQDQSMQEMWKKHEHVT